MLSTKAQEALAQLAGAGELPAKLFWGTFGAVRGASETHVGTAKPWLEPQCAAEELYYSGILHPCGSKRLWRAAQVQVSAEIRQLVGDALPKPRIGSAADEVGEDTSALLHDTTQWLIYVTCQPRPRLYKQRWLRPPNLMDLNHRLIRQQRSERLKSHRRNSWLAFVAFVAAAAGLHAGEQLTAVGWAWLRMTPAEQSRYLWQAWRVAPESVRRLYGLPSGGITPAGLAQLVECLPKREEIFSARQLLHWFTGAGSGFSIYLNTAYPALEDLESIARHLLATELSFLGIVKRVAGSAQGPQRYTVTPAGKQLLNNSAGTEDSSKRELLFRSELLGEDEELEVKIAGQGAAAAQAVLAQYAVTIGHEQSGDGQALGCIHRYKLNRVSVGRAVASGQRLPTLFAALHEAEVRTSMAQQSLLASWAAEGEAIRLRTVTIVETRTAQLFEEILDQPRVHALVGRVLRPTVGIVKGSSVNFVEELLAAGRFVAETAGRPAPQRPGVPDGSAAALWLAGMVYAEIGRFTPLPLPPPYAAMAALYDGLSTHERTAVEGYLEEVAANLMRWLDHFSFAPPPEPTDPARWVAHIKEAIDTCRRLALDYFSAGRNMVVHFVVEPYWLEEHNGVPYLRGDPGGDVPEAILFRLDRVCALAFAE
jgi:hypothetical protein